jgi:hypothetical protein
MSAENQLTNRSRTKVALESSFGSIPATTYNIIALTDSFDASSVMPKELENLDESTYLFDNKTTVFGMVEGNLKFEANLKLPRTILSASAGRPTTGQSETLKAFFGSRTEAAGAFIVATGTTSTAVVTVGSGSNWTAGQWLLVGSGSGNIPRKVTAVSGDTLSLYPNLPNTATSGALAGNSTTYVPAQDNSLSLSVLHTLASTGMQWQYQGCAVNELQFDISRNALVKMTVNAMVGSGSALISGSQAVTVVNDQSEHTSPIAVNNVICWLQPTTTTTATHYPFISAQLKLNNGMKYIEELGGLEGKSGCLRTGNRDFVNMTLKIVMDVTQQSQWNAQTDLFCSIAVPKGTGTGRQWMVFELPTCNIVGQPKWSSEGGQSVLTLELKGKIDALIPAASTDLGLSPFKFHQL